MTNIQNATLDDWKDKKVAVLGLGVEGVSTVRFLHKKGIKVWVLDKRKREEIDQDIVTQIEHLGARFILGENYLENLSQFAVIVRTPGIRRNLPEILDAEIKGSLITSQSQLFFDLCPCPVIGVTGTKGKGTTATLIYEMLKKAEKDLPDGRHGVYLGGNIGVPPLDFVEDLTSNSWAVLELSSFQLQDLGKSPHSAEASNVAKAMLDKSRGKPHIAVMLMVTSEHLDYHGDIAEYVNAKRNILRNQTSSDFAILNRDYIASNESDIYAEGKVFFVSREREPDEGCFVRDAAIWIRREGREKKIIDTERILLPGKHNLENVCAAVMAATLAGIEKEDIVQVLTTFKGLEHRLELVAEINGVKYYDDSFSTTPETAIAAIQAFTAPEILILGGSSKNSDFSALGAVINNAKNIKAIIGIGEEWERIKKESRIKNQESRIILVEGAKDMKTIVTAARKIAQPGDVVLLSPACASFDMFKNYKKRGEQFKYEVEMGLA